jgi:DNA-binding response OmpR family regulator
MEVKAVTKTVVKDIHSTVLVVEDEEGVRNLMVTALENCGYNTLQASRPVEAIVLSDRYAGAIDLLVTDVVMPEMKGDELARQLKNRRNNLRTLFVTGYTTFGTLENSEVLLKPFNTAELLERVHKVLDGRCV